jgi:plasmid stabilization system protein ParE
MKKIKYLKASILDLENIFQIIYNDKQNAAKEYLVKLKKFIELLEMNPKMGKDCWESGFNRDCRVIYYKNYIILYKVNKTYISIKRVLSSKQNNKGD